MLKKGLLGDIRRSLYPKNALGEHCAPVIKDHMTAWQALCRTTTGMFISTQHNMVYGFDADSFGSAPMWSRSLGTSTNANDISTARYCSDIPYEEARTILLVQWAAGTEDPQLAPPPAQWRGILLALCPHVAKQQVTGLLCSHHDQHAPCAPAWRAALLENAHLHARLSPLVSARQGILSTGVISPGGVWYVVANVRNADSSISWVRPSAQGSWCMELQATIADSLTKFCHHRSQIYGTLCQNAAGHGQVLYALDVRTGASVVPPVVISGTG